MATIITAALVASTSALYISPRLARTVVPPTSINIGRTIASGKYGSVVYAQQGGAQVVAKFAADEPRATEYLATEAEINRLLNIRAPLHSSLDVHQRSVAPYRGTCVKDGKRLLVWSKAGEGTLADYLSQPRKLARALGCRKPELPRVVLHRLLEALAHVHACGIAHRDIKPANVLVDPKSQSLRLIDFGSSVDCAGWISRRGMKKDKLPCSYLFMPAGWYRYDDCAGWYAYDVYAAALVWLVTAVPALAQNEAKGLYDLRMALKSHKHDAHAWRAAASGPPADGWSRAFGWEGDSAGGMTDRAWELLTSMIELDPTKRPQAAEALLGPYLNHDCVLDELPLPAAQPWTLEAFGPPKWLAADACPANYEEEGEWWGSRRLMGDKPANGEWGV